VYSKHSVLIPEKKSATQVQRHFCIQYTKIYFNRLSIYDWHRDSAVTGFCVGHTKKNSNQVKACVPMAHQCESIIG
jgi:hypothetical protein